MTTSPDVFIGPPGSGVWLHDAVVDGGGRVVDESDRAEAVVWVSESDPDGLAQLLHRAPDIRWVQLPWAGIGPFVPLLDHDRTWTCAKGAYARPTAEHALTLALAGYRDLHVYARASSWLPDHGRSLFGAPITIVGGGGIARELLRLIAPFECRATVVRRSDDPVPGAERTVTVDGLHGALAGAELVVLALALTPASRGIIGRAELDVMGDQTWLVNVARGPHVETEALVEALRSGSIRGAGLDVTDPEPLPDHHDLWTLDNVIITPHSANTRAMARPYLITRVTDNVRRFAAGEPLEGVVDPDAGY